MGLLVEGTGYEIAGVQRGDVYNTIVIKTITSVDSGDTIVVDVTKYGISATGIIGVWGSEHTTENSVMAQADPTTTVSGDEITLTATGNTDKQKFYFIRGFAVPHPGAAI